MMQKFVLVNNIAIHLDSIDYIEYLPSGGALIVMRGVTSDKQNIAVDEAETRRLRAFLEPLTYTLDRAAGAFHQRESGVG